MIIAACLFVVFVSAGMARYFAGLPMVLRAQRRAIWLGFVVAHASFAVWAVTSRQLVVAAVGAFFATLALAFGVCWRAGIRNPAPLPPAVPIAASVAGRRLRDFTRWPLEAAFAGLNVAAWLAGSTVVWILLYGQMLLLFTKHALVRSSMPLPASAAARHERSLSEQLRTLSGFLDRFRGVCAFAALGITLGKAFVPFGLLLAGWSLWDFSRTCARAETLGRELKEETGYSYVLAHGAHGHFLGGGLVYWNSRHGAPVVQGPLGYTLNAANPWAVLYLASLAGFLALFAYWLGLL